MPLAVIAAGLLALLGTSGLTQRPEVLVSSASVRVIRKPVQIQVVYIENLRPARLVEWEFALAPAATPDRPSGHSHYFRIDGPFVRDDGPIASARSAGSVRPFRVQADDGSPHVASMTLAVFADGVVDGTLAAVTTFRDKQAALVADLVAWQVVFNALPRTEPDALAMLRQHRDAAVRQRPEDVSRIRGQVTGWLEGARPRGWIFSVAESLKQAIPERLATATRYRDGAIAALQDRAALGTNLTSFVSARAASGQGQNLMALVENLRDTPLEAFDLEIYDSPASRYPSSGRSYDACGVSRGQPGSGRVVRGETREIDLGPADSSEDRPLPVIVIKMAIWADQSWEGDPDMRAERLRQRVSTSRPNTNCSRTWAGSAPTFRY
jgi:hypothetical protein